MVNDLDRILMVTVFFVCAYIFIFKLIGNIYMGLQLPAVSNMLIATGQTLMFIGTFSVYKSGSHSLLHIAMVNTLSPLLVYLLAYPYTFFFRFPRLRPAISLVNLREAREVISMGVQFFVLQISGVVLFMTSNILISKLFTPSMVTPYQIAYRYFSIMLVAFTVICMPFWNATTDAYERGDLQWIHRATRKLRLMTVGIFVSMIVMILLSNFVYSVWIGQGITIDICMSITVAIYIFILIYSMRYSYFINGIGKLRLQLIFSVTAAILFIPLAYIVVRWTGSIIWFIAVMCFTHHVQPSRIHPIRFNSTENSFERSLRQKEYENQYYHNPQPAILSWLTYIMEKKYLYSEQIDSSLRPSPAISGISTYMTMAQLMTPHWHTFRLC